MPRHRGPVQHNPLRAPLQAGAAPMNEGKSHPPDPDSRTAFDLWFSEWKEARPDDAPIGFYRRSDLRAAFLAGMSYDLQRGLEAIVKKILRGLEQK